MFHFLTPAGFATMIDGQPAWLIVASGVVAGIAMAAGPIAFLAWLDRRDRHRLLHLHAVSADDRARSRRLCGCRRCDVASFVIAQM